MLNHAAADLKTLKRVSPSGTWYQVQNSLIYGNLQGILAFWPRFAELIEQ
jgi:hypothetical protein